MHSTLRPTSIRNGAGRLLLALMLITLISIAPASQAQAPVEPTVDVAADTGETTPEPAVDDALKLGADPPTNAIFEVPTVDVNEPSGMPLAYPDPAQPIPYNKPGRLSKMGIDTRLGLARAYEPWAARVSAMSLDEATAALGYTADYDPFASQRTLVEWDQVAVITPGANSAQYFRTYKGAKTDDNLHAVQGGLYSSGIGAGFTRTGDINGDGIDEIVTTTGDRPNNKVQVGNLSEKRYSKGAPAIASPRPGETWQFARGYDDGLWGFGASWGQMGGGLTSGPTALTVGDNVHVLVLGDGADVYRCPIARGAMAFPWCAWTRLGVAPAGRGSFTGEPAIGLTAANEYDVFVRGSDNTLWRLPNGHLADQNRTDWENLGGYITSPPAAAGRGDGRVDVVALGYDSAVWHMWRANAGTPWSAWTRVPGSETFKYAPAIVARGTGALDAYAVDPGYDAEGKAHLVIKRSQYRNGAWSGWSVLPVVFPSPPASAPTATEIQGAGSVKLAYRGEDGLIYASTLDGAFAASPQLGMWSAQHAGTNLRTFELGHFMANGRMQAIDWHLSFGEGKETDQLVLDAYDFGGGSEPRRIVQQTFTLSHKAIKDGAWFYSAVGDVDGDGVEELGWLLTSDNYAYLYVFKLAGDGKKIVQSRIPQVLIENQGGWDPRLTIGDFDGQNADDELAVGLRNGNLCRLRIYDAPQDSTALPLLDDNDHDCGVSQGWALSSGNFIAEASGANIVDEIVYAGIYPQLREYIFPYWHDRYWLRAWLFRLSGGKIQEKAGKGDDLVLDVGDVSPEPGWSISVTGADLQRSGQEKIAVWLQHTFMAATGLEPAHPGRRYLYTYRYNNGLAQWAERRWFDGDRWDYDLSAAMVSGSLSGEGLRLAKPTYRLIDNLGKLVAKVSAPPKIYDENYNNPNNPDDPHVVNPESKATITLGTSQEQKIEVKAKTHWNLDAELKGTLGDEDSTHITASLKGSVGQDFENVRGSTKTFEQTTSIESYADKYVYALTDYQLYEYPVVDGSDGQSSNMTVTTSKGAIDLGVYGLSCSRMFNPGHEINNLLSYPASERDLPGYRDDGKYLATNIEYDATSGGNFEARFENGNDSSFEQSTQWSVTAGIEGEYSGEIGSVSASVEGTYGQTAAATQSVATSNTIGVGGQIQLLGPNEQDRYNHDFKPYFYWTADKTLVLDYVVTPQPTEWWDDPTGWMLADLAFIRPLRGLDCSPAQGQSRDDQSPDITFSDYTPVAGQQITATAAVHNYGRTDITTGVSVKFYKGDPTAGGAQICEQTIVRLNARKQVAVTCQFTADGFGEQRIYAQARPVSGSVKERDVTNNKAYAVVSVATPSAALDADPGLINRKQGALLELDTGGGRLTRFFAPYKSLEDQAVTSFKLEPWGTEARAFTVRSTQFVEGVWTTVERTLGLDDENERNYGQPTAWVSVQYTDADRGLGDEGQIGLFTWDANSRRWVDTADTCGPVVRDPVNNVLQGPICRTGRYALAPLRNMTYLPLLSK